MRSLRLLLCASALVAAPTAAAADSGGGLNDFFGPREIAIGESMRADARGNMATTLNPAGLGLSRQLVFMGSYGFRPDDNASAVSVSACDSTVIIPGCFYYNYFTSSVDVSGFKMSRRVHQFGATAARAITDRILIGVNSKYFDYNSDLTGEEDSSGFAVDAGLILRPTESINLAAVGYNLVAEDSPQYPRGFATGVSVRPHESFAIAFDALWNFDAADGEKGGRYSGGAEYFFSSDDRQSGFPIRAGAVHDSGVDSTFITAGLGYINRKVGLDLGMRKQVNGGDAFMFHAGLSFYGPALPPPR